jgi:iron complex transport system substrate-binding protein
MHDERSATRRSILRAAGGTTAGALVAGCAGDSAGSQTADRTTTGNREPSATPGADTTTASATAVDAADYSVSMEPVGEVTFATTPETWVANNGSWADMGIALGLDPPAGVWLTSRYHTQYYDAIDGVSVDKRQMVSLYQDGVSEERFYALDADVHVIDPNFLLNRFKGWDRSTVDTIADTVGPFFGNSIFSRGYGWHDYRYYTMLEAFEKLAQVFQRRDRYEAFASLHEDFQAALETVRPSAEEDRPAAAVLWANGDEPETFSPYLIGAGTSFKHLRDLGVRDALATADVEDFHSSRAEVDLETLLSVDPDVLLLRGQEAKSASTFRETTVAFLEDHDVAGELTAVRNGDVYRAGGLYQGPITNLVLTQRLGEQLYGVEDQVYDPDRVASIVNRGE